jgi:hypothetical protein
MEALMDDDILFAALVAYFDAVGDLDDVEELNDWERGFLDSMMEKYDEYGEDAILSLSQAEVLERILMKVGVL